MATAWRTKRKLVFAGGPRGGNLEHQQSGLIWALDNWIYQSTAASRLRMAGAEMMQEKCTRAAAGNGAWRRMITARSGGAMPAAKKGSFTSRRRSSMAATTSPGQFPPDFLEVWPLLGLADYQGGPMRVRPSDKTLNHFTASCGQEVVRGDRLPADLRGDVLISEPVGRLIRRAKVEVKDGITTISNPYGHSEFIRSTDPNFRIVNMANGPDGCLYLVDMYRGIIQEGNWTKEGSYLRKVIQQYGMEKVAGHGRIWRLRHTGLPARAAAEDACGNSGRTRRASGASEWLVARHRAEAARLERRQVRRAAAHQHGAQRAKSARAASTPFGRWKVSTRSNRRRSALA